MVILQPKTMKEFNLKNSTKILLGDLKGRDKVLRLVQYFTKFLVYHIKESDPKSDLGKRIELLSKGLSLHRKAFKVGGSLEELQKLLELLEETKKDLKRSLNLMLRASMVVFLALDNTVWLTSLKTIDLDKDGIKKKAYRFRLFAALLNTAIGMLDLQKQAGVVTQSKPGTEERVKAEEKQGANVIAMVKNVADVITYSNSAEIISMIRGSKLDDGTAGLIGTISSVAAIYSIWIKK